MKKVKIERINETGEGEIVALNATMPLSNRSQDSNEELKRKGSESPQKADDDPIVKEQLKSFPLDTTTTPSTNTTEQQQNQQTSQPQQNQPPQQFPNIPRTLPAGAPANYCNICNKELCNKYFMKTHMQKMHGINLDDYPREAANSGGVVCDICQKELCSKYFLKVHKTNTHGVTDFSSGSAGSHAANAATAVAAIALTNYSLNNAQKRAALNLALNQHQLQSRQAAALMNAASAAFNPLQMAQAAKAAAIQQRDQLHASSLIGQLSQNHPNQQSQQQQQPASHLDLHLHKQQPNHQQQSQQMQRQAPPSIPTSTSASAVSNLHAAFPAALLAATAGNPLLAAQLAQQQHQFASLNGHQPQQVQMGQQQHRPSPFFPLNEDPLDTEEDTSDRESISEQSTAAEQHHKNCLAMNNFHQQLQSQQALLNAAAVFNPAAAAVMAIQRQQQQLQQQEAQRQQQQQFSLNQRQQAAIDLRNQSIGQLIAQQMIGARQQHEQPAPTHQQQLVSNCNNILNMGVSSNDNNTTPAQFQASRLYQQQEDESIQQHPLQQPNRLQQQPVTDYDDVEEDDDEDDFDSDRDSLVDEGVFRQATAGTGPVQSGPHQSSENNSMVANNGSSSQNNNNGSLLGSSISNKNDNDDLINCSTADHKRSMLSLASHTASALSTTATTGNTTDSSKQQLRLGTSNKYPQLNRAANNNDPFPPSNNISPQQISNLLNASPSPIATTNSAAAIQRTSTSSSSRVGAAGSNDGAGNNGAGGGGSNNNSSRYLRHYTEMCPICDRRFKSIKWLQSHVMNDHKNEIGNQLFSLLVQILLCSNNGAGGGAASGNSGINGSSSGGSVEQMPDSLSSGTVGGGSIAGLSETLAGLVGVAELQQQQQQQQPAQRQPASNQFTDAASTATRGDV